MSIRPCAVEWHYEQRGMRACRTCERRLCPICDYGKHGAGLYVDCVDCRWVPDCERCGHDLLWTRRGSAFTATSRDMRSALCHPCVLEVWVEADEKADAERRARLARQRMERKANPPEPGKAWARSAAHRLTEYGWDSEVVEFTKAEVVERQGSESCAICNSPDNLVLDHIHPLAAGGPHTLDNVRLLCAPCNGWKVAEIDRPLIEAARAKARRAELSTAA